MKSKNMNPIRKRYGTKLLLLVLAVAALSLPAADLRAQASSAHLAPKPLFRDPVHDGAADPTLIWNRARKEWWMFYTNRRADLASGGQDVSWVHGTRIGIAVSRDGGAHWSYRGTANIPYGTAEYTHWAPDVVFWKGEYHMFLTIVPGIFRDWNAPREIVHLTSADLEHWTFDARLELGSARVIDPALYRMPNGIWRIWYKNEVDHSHIYYADSSDLKSWKLRGVAVSDRGSEAPKVFRWRGSYWLITDAWKGLGVYRSDDLEHWKVQADNLLHTPGQVATDRTDGHHCDVVVAGDRAFLYYFTQQGGADVDPKLSHSADRSVLQVAELKEEGGVLSIDRDAPVHVDLGEGSPRP